MLGLLIFALLESLPLLLFLRFVPRSVGAPTTNNSDNYRLIVGLFLVFHFSLYGLESIRQLPVLFHRLLGDMALPDLNSLFPFLASTNVGQMTVALVLAGYVWPRFVERCTSAHAIALAPEKIPVLRLLTVVLIGVTAIISLSRFESLPLIWMLVAWCGIGVLMLLLSTSALLNATLRRNQHGGHKTLATVTLILLPVAGFLIYNPSYLPGLLIAGEPTILSWLLPAVILLAAALPLILYFAELVYRVFTDRSLQGDKITWPKWARVALVIGAALLVYPSRWLVNGEATPASWRDIFNLAYILDDLIRLPFLWILLVILRREAETAKGTELTPMARNMGIIVALTFFYSPTIRWLYVPIVFLLGYVVLSRWLLVEDPKLASIAGQILAKRRKIIQTMVAQNYARRALRQMKRTLIKKAEDPNFDLKAHEDRVRTLEESNRTVETQEPLTIAGVPTGKLALAVGSSTSNWENGKRTALYGVFFAVPWIVLYFMNVAVDSNLDEGYFVLHFFSLSLSLLVQWSLYGFFFGYFFASIRGRNGLQKGLSYFTALVVPHVAITIIFVPAGIRDWPEFGVWVLQIFIQTMLLGLVAGDYESLRRSRLGWFQLVEIHNFSALASWASSTALAIGAAITALLASVGPDLVRGVFQLGRMAAPELGVGD